MEAILDAEEGSQCIHEKGSPEGQGSSRKGMLKEKVDGMQGVNDARTAG